MANVHDVAAYVLERLGERTPGEAVPVMKLQKLVYYSQAWSLVWDDRPLFPERIEAWANGPVVPDLYRLHRGEYSVTSWRSGDPARLSTDERETVDAILKAYGGKTSWELSAMTHSEAPWRDARAGLAPGERGTTEITPAAMAEYYGGLP